jgi:NAD dependent epimerase/dehydratase family enzyme
VSGPCNITTPHPVRSEQFTEALAAKVGKRARLRVPMSAVQLAMGDAATEVFGSLRVIPAKLTGAGFRHQHPNVYTALSNALSAGII